MATTSLVVREYNTVEIPQRREDGYFNATAMCRANGKFWSNYWQNQAVQEFIAALEPVLGIPRTELVQVRQGGIPSEQGTWVHPRVAMHLAQWCSAEFAVLVSGWVYDLLTTGRVELSPEEAASPTLAPYTHRILSCWDNRRRVPEGHWSIFEESAQLLILAEAVYIEAGLEMDKLDLLDGSVGTHWSRHREGQPWTVSRVQYPHAFPADDPRRTRLAWAYALSEMPHFWCWLRGTYMTVHFPQYLSDKFGRAAVRLALPVFQRRGLLTAINEHN